MAFKPVEKKTLSSHMGDMNFRVLRRDDYRNYIVEIEIMRSGWNNNNWNFKNIAEYAKTFEGTPILIAYISSSLGDGIGDGHNSRMKKDPKTGKMYHSFTDSTSERAVGYITDKIKVVQKDGEDWVVAEGVIWEVYNKELVDKLMRTGRMSVSAETRVVEIELVQQGEIFHTWEALGVTILGDGVTPAVPNANVHVIQAAREKVLEVRAAQQKGKGVKKKMTKQQYKELSQKFEGYNVIGSSGDTVVMLNENLEAFTYTFSSEDKGQVDATRISAAEAEVVVKVGEEQVTASLESILGEAIQHSEKNKELSEKLDRVSGKLKEMKGKMLERDRADYVTAAKSRLAEINKNRELEDQVPEEEIENVTESAAEMEFEENCDVKNMASKAVDAKAMTFMLGLDKKKAEAKELEKKSRYTFEQALSGSASSGDLIQDAIKRLRN